MRWSLGKLRPLIGDDDGVTTIEYGLIVAVIGIVLILSLDFIGNETDDMFGSVATELANQTS